MTILGWPFGDFIGWIPVLGLGESESCFRSLGGGSPDVGGPGVLIFLCLTPPWRAEVTGLPVITLFPTLLS